MITRKSVSKALERGDYDSLPPLKKKLLKLHVHLCTMCGPYNGFIMSMQDTSREFCKHEELDGAGCTECLPEGSAEKMKQSLRKEQQAAGAQQ